LPTTPPASAFRRPWSREAALASHLSPDCADRLEAALARRLDRKSRHLERIERHVDISNEALAVFVRFWLTSTQPCPTPPGLPRSDDARSKNRTHRGI
jgi:hypothetical protein